MQYANAAAAAAAEAASRRSSGDELRLHNMRELLRVLQAQAEAQTSF